MMARKRELRYFLYPANAISALIVYACIASLGLLAFGSYPSSPAYIGAKTVAAVILIGLGLATLHALVALVFR